jgi:hypothetical protein
MKYRTLVIILIGIVFSLTQFLFFKIYWLDVPIPPIVKAEDIKFNARDDERIVSFVITERLETFKVTFSENMLDNNWFLTTITPTYNIYRYKNYNLFVCQNYIVELELKRVNASETLVTLKQRKNPCKYFWVEIS